MNDQDTNPTARELSDLRDKCAGLRAQTANLQIALLVAVVMLAGFFWLEVRRSSQTLRFLRPQAIQVGEASKRLDVAVQNLAGKLTDYGRTHADFTPILIKYGIMTNSAAPAAPATKPAAAKPITPAPAPKR
jgi:hypothetical protein